MKDKREQQTPVYDIVKEETGFAIHRNGRYLMTPAGSAYRVPTERMAETVAQEWRTQTDKIVPAQMPVTQLVATALDIVSKDRGKITRGLLAYIGSELLCHRVETPSSLVQKQNDLWEPVITWCQTRYDIHLNIGSGVMPISQSPEISERLGTVLDAYDNFKLAGLSSATDTAGSLLLGLAMAEGFINADKVFAAAELDFAHQAVTWGDDPVTQARQATVRKDLEACELWFSLF